MRWNDIDPNDQYHQKIKFKTARVYTKTRKKFGLTAKKESKNRIINLQSESISFAVLFLLPN